MRIYMQDNQMLDLPMGFSHVGLTLSRILSNFRTRVDIPIIYKVEVKYEPSEIVSRYGYSHFDFKKGVATYGKQFITGEEI